MTISVPFQQQFTFRKLGYLYFENSLSYRQVLEQNPQWKVTELPPIGAELRVQGTQGSAGGLTQGNFITGLPVGDERDDIFPFDTEPEYTSALNRYTLQGVVGRQAINGIVSDSEQAFTGQQQG